MMIEEDRMKEINFAIREIDPERNGYVTNQELDDIIRINYSKQMEGKHLFEFVKQFSSVSNPILIDYNLFKKHLYTAVKERKEALNPSKKKLNALQQAIQARIR